MRKEADHCTDEYEWGRRWMDEVTLAEMTAELDLAAVEVYTIQQDRPLRLSYADVGSVHYCNLAPALM